MQVAAADYQHAAAERGRQERLQLGDVRLIEGVWLVGKYDDIRTEFDRVLEGRDGIALTRRRENVIVAEHPQHVMRVGVGVERHPRLLPDRAENAEPQFAPHAERRLDTAHAERDFLGKRGRLLLATEHAAQSQDRFDRARHRTRIGSEHRDTRGAHSLEVFAPILLGVRDYQLRFEFHYRGDVWILGTADFWNRCDRRDRLDAEFRDTHDFGIEAECEQRLSPA